MNVARTAAFFALLAATLLPARTARADDLATVLRNLDAAAKNFHTVSADVEFDTIQTVPIPDTDVMKGVVYYEHAHNHFQMAAHITSDDNLPVKKIYIFSGGVFRLSENGSARDAKTYPQATRYEGYLMLGFGASGKELAEKWTIKYLGTEVVDGVMTDKLLLIAKDPDVRRTIPQVTLWMDTSRAVSLKQVFDEGDGLSRVCHYTNIKLNERLPKSAFTFLTGK